MVGRVSGSCWAALAAAAALPWLLGADPQAGDGKPIPGLEKLDPVTRTRVLLGLLAIVLLGIGLILMVTLSARMVRRWTRFSPQRKPATPLPPRRPKPDEPQNNGAGQNGHQPTNEDSD